MSSEPITDSPDPRLQAALAEYLERIDQGEAVDRNEFLAEHPDLAAMLAPLLETADALEQIGGNTREPRTPDVSTHSQLSHDIETIAPGRQGQEVTTSGPLPAEFGRYRVIKSLGQGAMGVVYLADDTQLHRQVALKTSSFDDDHSGELLERFYREARSAANLRHPNICPVYDVGEIQGRHYISLAYIEGRTLATYVNANGSLHERQVLVLIRKLALALEEAHKHEVVHRDLKPANIMVDLRGEPIIMDFGLARVGYSAEESRLTQVGMIVGSPAYMAPEQIGGQPELLTGAADQYSLGVILFELLIGHPPFRGPVTAVVGQILTQPPPRPGSLRSDLSSAVESLCLKMLSKSPKDRFASTKHVADEIAALLRGSSAEQRPLVASAKSGAEDRSQPETSTPKASLHEALIQEARQRLKQRDYPKAIEMLQQIPETERPPEAAKLLAQALKLMDEVNFVLQEMEAALQSRDGATLARRAQELVKLKPDHPRPRQVRELIKKHGAERALQFLAEESGSTAATPYDTGNQRRVGLLAGGILAVMLLGIVIWFGSGKTRLKVTVNDPTIEVTFRGNQLSIQDGASQVEVDPGEQELTIRLAGVEFQTPKFTLKRGTTSVVEVEQADEKLSVNLAGTELVAWPLENAGTASAVGTVTHSVTTTADTNGKIDLLAAVDVSQLGDSEMRWERQGQTVVCTGTGAAGKSDWKGFRFPTEIGGDYEVELEFQQRAFWPMQIDFPLQDTAVRVSLTGDFSDLNIADDKEHPNAERTWRSSTAKLKSMVPQRLLIRVRQSGTRAEIEATLDGVTLGTYRGERSRIVLPSWIKPNFKQITSGSLCGNLAEGYIELRRAVYRPLTSASQDQARVLTAAVPAPAVSPPNAAPKAEINVSAPQHGRVNAAVNSALSTPATLQPNTVDGWTDLFNGRDLTGWTAKGVQGWRVENGVLVGETHTEMGWLMTNTEYQNFELDFEYRLAPGTNSGMFLRAWHNGRISGRDFLEIQLLDESDEVHRTMTAFQRTGALYDILNARPLTELRPNMWHRMNIAIHGQDIRVQVNGQAVTRGEIPAGKQQQGHIGLQLYPRTTPQRCEFQKLRVRPLKEGLPVSEDHAEPNRPMAIIDPMKEPAEPEGPDDQNNEEPKREEIRNGLRAEIYAGQNFERKVTEKNEPDLDCFWNLAAPAIGAPVDGFSVRFSGWLKAPRSGRYKIGFSSDDGLRVSIDGRKVIDDWKVGDHYREASVELTEEPLAILVETFDHAGPAYLSAFWLPTGQSTPCLIPSEAFFLTEEAARSPAVKPSKQRHSLLAEYFDLSFTRKLATHRVIRAETSWHTATPQWGLPTVLAARYSGYIVPPKTGQYKIVGLGDDWMRVWIDNKPALEAKFEQGIQTALINLEAGKPHAIRIEHANGYLDGEYFLHWVEPGGTHELSIPPECLFPSKAAAQRAATDKQKAAVPEKDINGVQPEVRHGLKAEIFEGQDFEKKVCERIEPNVECFWELGAPASEAPVNNFSVRFTGWLRAPKAGRYKLILSSKDGSRLKINNQAVIDNWKLKPEVVEVSVELTQDPQPIEVEVFNADLYSWVSLLWQPAGSATASHIPATAFYPDLENARSKASRTNIEKTGLVAEYFDKSFGRRLATDRVYRIEEIWGPHSPRWGLPTDSAAKYTGVLVPPVSGQYKLVTSARGHIRVWIDDKPTVEAKGIQTAQNAVVELEANKQYEIRVEILTTGHGAHYLHWIPPGTTKEVSIPPECLFPNKAAVRQVTSGPVIKAPTEEKPTPNTISAAERETIERGLAQLKADDEAAGKKLLKDFDAQFEKVRAAPKLSADERVVRIKSLEDEKSLFEKHGHIPFSLAMRTETLKYLREFTEARTDTAKVYDRLIESLTKRKSDEAASLLRTERDIAVGPKVVAIWRTVEVSGGKKTDDWSIWSNGSVGKSNRQFLWMMDERRFAIQWTRTVDTFVFGEDCTKASIVNENGVKIYAGERVAP